MILDKFNTINEYINIFKINKIMFCKNGLYELIVPNLIRLKTCKNRKLVKSYLTIVKIILSLIDFDEDFIEGNYNTYGFIVVLNRSL